MAGQGAACQARPKHICYVISKLGVGGAEKNLLLLTRSLPKDRYAPVVLSLNGEGAYADFLRQAGVPVYSLGFPHPLFLWRIIQFFWRCRFDLFHGFMFHGNIAARILAALFRKPSISAMRVAEGEKGWHLTLDKLTSRLVDRYTANSKALAGFVTEKHLAPVEKITVIANALSEDDLRPAGDRGAARKALGIPEIGTLVAMVGRLHIQKDPETFVCAAKKISTEIEDARFLIAGIGPLQEKIQSLILDLNLQDIFHLTGLADARAVYTACDIFVLPSRWEGFPNSAIEAMSAGKPVVLADFAGADEVVDYGITGLVFPRGDDRALAEAVVSLLHDGKRREEMGRRARDTARSRYTVERLVSGNVMIYEQLTRYSKPK